MNLKKLFAVIGLFFKSLFNSALKAYYKLSPEVQAAFLQGSGIIEILNTPNLSLAGKIDKINATYPHLANEQIIDALKAVAESLNIILKPGDDVDVYSLLQVIQPYFDNATGGKWAKWSSLAAKTIAAVFAPKGTKSSVFEMLMETVFQLLIKDKI